MSEGQVIESVFVQPLTKEQAFAVMRSCEEIRDGAAYSSKAMKLVLDSYIRAMDMLAFLDATEDLKNRREVSRMLLASRWVTPS